MNEKIKDTNIDWDDLKLFLAVARAGGLSAATAITGKSAPTLGRRMVALEAITASELFYRRARGYELTEQGKVLLSKVVDLEAQILPLDRSSDTNGTVLVKVSAGSWMTHILCQNIESILKRNESTCIRFISAERELDIAHRETIIGIRNQRPIQNGLACSKVGRVQFAGYATGKQVKSWIKVVGKTPSAVWLAEQSHLSTMIEITGPRNALDLACTGIGRALLPTFVGDAQKDLIRVTTPIAELAHDQWLVTHQDERLKPAVRLTIDRIAQLVKSLHGKTR